MPRVFCIKALNKINLQNYCTVWARAFLIYFKQCKNISVLTNMKTVRCRNNLQNTANLSLVSYSGTIACLLRLNKFVHPVAIHSGEDYLFLNTWVFCILCITSYWSRAHTTVHFKRVSHRPQKHCDAICNSSIPILKKVYFLILVFSESMILQQIQKKLFHND